MDTDLSCLNNHDSESLAILNNDSNFNDLHLTDILFTEERRLRSPSFDPDDLSLQKIDSFEKKISRLSNRPTFTTTITTSFRNRFSSLSAI